MQTSQNLVSIDPMDRWVWGIPAISKIIDRTISQTYYLAEGGYIDVEKVAGRWRSTPRRLLAPNR